MSSNNETPNCVICMEISVTMTDCNHPLCRDCYKKMDDLPAHQRNMKKCPYCRKENPQMKDVEIELTDEQKLEHYQTLMEFYREHTIVVPKAAGSGVQYPPVQPVRAPVRVPEGQGLRPEAPQPAYLLAHTRMRGEMNVGRTRQFLLENPRYVGFEDHHHSAALARRKKVIKDSPITFVVRQATLNMDVAVMESVFDVGFPATSKTTIYTEDNITIGDIPFNCRPMMNCRGCQKKTRRCCTRCVDNPICAGCGTCGDHCPIRQDNYHFCRISGLDRNNPLHGHDWQRIDNYTNPPPH